MDNCLPYLSTYMGHEKFQYTAYYIHLVPDFVPEIRQLIEGKYDHIIPEVEDTTLLGVAFMAASGRAFFVCVGFYCCVACYFFVCYFCLVFFIGGDCYVQSSVICCGWREIHIADEKKHRENRE